MKQKLLIILYLSLMLLSCESEADKEIKKTNRELLAIRCHSKQSVIDHEAIVRASDPSFKVRTTLSKECVKYFKKKHKEELY